MLGHVLGILNLYCHDQCFLWVLFVVSVGDNNSDLRFRSVRR